MRRFRVRLPWPSLGPPSRRLHASTNSGGSGARQGNFLLPGASAAALVMLGVLHARRMYNDKKLVERMDKGIEPEFFPDLKASFFRLLPLRSISCLWGSLMEVEVPVFMRPAIYKAWARAFHSSMHSPVKDAFFCYSLSDNFSSKHLMLVEFNISRIISAPSNEYFTENLSVTIFARICSAPRRISFFTGILHPESQRRIKAC